MVDLTPLHVSVGIVGFRNDADIENCLRALAAQTHADFSVVICENGGAAAFEALQAVAPQSLPGGQTVTVIKAPRNLGYAGGVNVTLTAAPDAGCWWVLNPDTIPEPQAMAALVARLTQGDVDAVGGVIAYPDGHVETYGGGLWRTWLASSKSIGHGAQLGDPVDATAVEARMSYVSGASMMVSRRFMEVVGLLREDYFLYCEEVEWFLRATARGIRLGFAPEARVIHLQGTSTGSVRSLRERPKTPVYLDTRNKVLVTRDRFPGRTLPVAAAVIAIMALKCLKHRAWRQFGYAIDGWRAGLVNERGAPAWLST